MTIGVDLLTQADRSYARNKGNDYFRLITISSSPQGDLRWSAREHSHAKHTVILSLALAVTGPTPGNHDLQSPPPLVIFSGADSDNVMSIKLIARQTYMLTNTRNTQTPRSGYRCVETHILSTRRSSKAFLSITLHQHTLNLDNVLCTNVLNRICCRPDPGGISLQVRLCGEPNLQPAFLTCDSIVSISTPRFLC